MSFIDSTPRERSSLRWLLLFICCFATFGSNYCFDTIGAIHEHLKSQFNDLGENFEYYYELMYSVYGIVNIVAPLLGGWLIKVFGPRLMLVIFGFIIVIGQFIVYYGCKNLSIATMIIGRFIFGLAGESLGVCQTAMVIRWFYKAEVSFPMALTVTISRIGSFTNDVLSPIIAGEKRIDGDLNATKAFFWGDIFSFASFILIVLSFIIDYLKEKAIKEYQSNKKNDENDLTQSSTFSNNIIDLFKQLNLMYFILCFIAVASYGALMPFNFMAVGFHTSKGVSKKHAGIYMGLPYLIGAILSPFIGVFVDKLGYRVWILLLGSISYITAFILFYFIHPIYPIFILGIGYGLFSSTLWPCLTISVENKELSGFCYGVASCLEAAVIAINPIINAWIYVTYGSYSYCLIFLACFSVICAIFVFWLYYENKHKRNGLLDRTNYEDEKDLRHKFSLELGSDSAKNFQEFKEEE